MSNEDSYSFVGEVEVVDDMCIISSSSSTLQSIILLLPLSTSSRYSRVALCAIDIDQSLLRSAWVSGVVGEIYRGSLLITTIDVYAFIPPKLSLVVALVDSGPNDDATIPLSRQRQQYWQLSTSLVSINSRPGKVHLATSPHAG